MSAIKSFLLAIEMATRKRDQANQDVMHVQSGHLFAQNQLTQLETYAAETESRWTAAAQISTSPELMRHHYQFMGRLHHAIGLQQGVLDNESKNGVRQAACTGSGVSAGEFEAGAEKKAGRYDHPSIAA